MAKVLKPTENEELASKLQEAASGDKEAMGWCMSFCDAVVWHTVSKLPKRWYSPTEESSFPPIFDGPDDCASEGFIGLGRAISKYDATRAATWYSYAYASVRGAIMKEHQKRCREANRPIESLDDVPASALAVEDDPSARLTRSQLENEHLKGIWQLLTSTEMCVVFNRLIDHRSTEYICEAFPYMTPRYVKAILRQGLKRLRKRLPQKAIDALRLGDLDELVGEDAP